ncbi:MAG: DUF115 domain-containing protein [Lachnospiraceae bacterium]|nr:DUF115 domain-containing protein [Lachnospiraceae bacterium]
MMTYRHFGTLPCRNELFALSVLNKSSLASALFKRLTDRNMPVVLVGAGPSLEKNVKELREVNKRALIVSASHSLRILQREGIVPDLIAEIDSKDWAFLEGENTACHLLISSQASLADQKQQVGRCIYFSFDQNIFMLQELQEEPVLSDNSGSVLTEMFELFVKYGFSRFILVGQDLAYSKEGDTHAGGEYQNEISGRKHIRVPGKHGDFVESRYDWIRFRDYYERQITNHPELTVLDATAEGALIKGAKVISLSDAINEVCSKEYPISEWLEKLPKAQSQDSYICMRKEMVKKTEELKTIALQIPRALMDNRRIQMMVNSGQMDSGIYTWICSQYDSKYHQILDGDASKLLLFYCEGMLQDYIANKLSVEAEDKILEKLILEEQLFTILEEKSKELIQYMEELWTN